MPSGRSESYSSMATMRRVQAVSGSTSARSVVSRPISHSKSVCTRGGRVSASMRSATSVMSTWNSSSLKTADSGLRAGVSSKSKMSERMLARRIFTPPSVRGGMKLTATSTPTSAAAAIHPLKV